ncbi:Glutamine-fructose-6-phosphate aminotransferase [Blattamonas nauphoetae]|uniref:glutamine--fructose-6-phosphate transaminase (isomerizing) n=1 Tax=Blattamonas nauphoetae TaxID=2049346 RepID=A0ABQ9XXI0_9EUKA|nr:Glutamine-fructose-6-phosphate aminotransferase [Blattamonas nauphoetae]
MCGIFAYIGGRPVLITLITGLKRLDYRGYDGAGVGLVNPQTKEIVIAKQAGAVSILEQYIQASCRGSILDKSSDFTLGIAHTRWPTMGAPTTQNTHPFFSNDKQWCVCLNGIVENSSKLTEQMMKEGYTFESENDVEVIAVLLEHLSKTYPDDPLSCFVATLSVIEGAYALCVLHASEERIYAAKLSSPLCIGIGDNEEKFLSSDPIAFREYTENVIHFDDNEICIISKDSFSVHKFRPSEGLEKDISHELRLHRTVKIPFSLDELELGNYPHYMLKEIYEQPVAVQRTYSGRIGPTHNYYASQIGKYIIERETHIPVRCEYASEFLTSARLFNRQDLVIAISQSGETADTREALLIAKRKGIEVAGLVNVVGSQIARIAGQGMYLHCGAEIGVASTKAFACQVAALIIFMLYLKKHLSSIRVSGDITPAHTPLLEPSPSFPSPQPNQPSSSRLFDPPVTKDVNGQPLEESIVRVCSALRDLPVLMQHVLSNTTTMSTIDEIVAFMKDRKSAIFLGRGIGYPVALEGALKMKEISYIHAEGYPAGEVKHGPIALIDEDMPVFFIVSASDSVVLTKIVNNMEEISTRGGKIITVTDCEPTNSDEKVQAQLKRVRSISAYTISVPCSDLCCSPILFTIPLQLIAYRIAVEKGINPDRPRNLAKSVTVE